MTSTFNDDNSAMAYIVRKLGTALQPNLARAVAEQFVVRCQMSDALDSWPHRVLEVGETVIGAPWWGPWTVREEELCDLRELGVGVATALTQPTDMPGIVPLVISAACMMWRLRRRGVLVNPLQRDVLLALRRRSSLGINALVREASVFGTDWTSAEVENALDELSRVRLNDGTVVELVHQTGDKSWSTSARGLWEVPFGAG